MTDERLDMPFDYRSRDGVEQRRALVRGVVQTAFIDRGMVADIAMYRPDRPTSTPISMLTTRPVDGIGFAGNTAIDKIAFAL